MAACDVTDRAGRPRLLDLFCCAGGATRGYQQAGFHVTGVDLRPQPNYIGDAFHQGDAVEFVREHGHTFDVIHASPPCQAGCTLTAGTNKGRTYPQLIPAVRDALRHVGRPYVIENVAGAPVRKDLRLCGEMFALSVIRHRFFELGGVHIPQPDHPAHRGRVAGMRHGEWFHGPYLAVYGQGGGKGSIAQWQQAMGITWTDVRKELAEAIPPAYTRHIGHHLIKALAGDAPVQFELPGLATP
ncbi:DNA cytosine methyltransferase [Sphaerisporangium rubeum]|uniref:DNA (Cytosine-5)-methyltransferase 1 n=1 Tax=Sphaerisporangium rubeum TaxID=321317 RepID=A0A7X0IFL2_9ACTN|nr:DNA cytosine methyltransferase [Sphaerisporangium rubeum]MBB6474329.1 DNA (cytosine-5)-methyltransferase 1 [Sphaerisporangium rubeum]